MKQNTNQIFKAEDLDWKELETAGIHKEKLESNGNMELLLQGEANGSHAIKNLHSHTPYNNGRHPQAHGRNGRKAGNGDLRP